MTIMINTEKWSTAKIPLERVYLFGWMWTPFVVEWKE